MAIITGTDGDDTVIQPVFANGTVFRSNDTIKTLAGNDTINAGLGKYDYVDGGTGIDRLILDYSVGDTGGGMNFNSGLNLNYSSAYRYNPDTGLYLDYIQFKNTENFTVIGTSKDDTIKTYYGTNVIQAGAGNDKVTAIAGTLDGGAGFDYLTLDLSRQTANLNLANLANPLNISVPGVVTASNFEQFAITTGSGNDIVTQSGIVNGAVLRANDSIKTGAGNDIINAGLAGGSVNDGDSVDGGAGIDRLIVDYSVGDTGTGMRFSGSTTYGFAQRQVSSTDNTRLDFIGFRGVEEFTVIGTSKNDSISTVSGNDIINAGAGNDILIGRGGGDILTGGIGADTFKYELYTDSLLANHDVITDFAIGSDAIDGFRAVAASQLKELGNVTALNEIAIKQVLTSANFSSYGASTFRFDDRTFLGLNDRTAGFSARTDSIIEITGYSGNLNNLAII